MIRTVLSHKRLPQAIIALLLPLLLWGCGASSESIPTAAIVQATATIAAPATPMPGMGMPTATTVGGANGELVQQETTQHYKLTLRLGPVAQMLTPEQAKSATSGEVMLGGQMAMAGGMSEGMTPNYHIEVAVADIKSGAVITDKSVSIDLTNRASSERTSVPIATMYDVQVGPSDEHFGNNVTLAPGNYSVSVDVGGETATFNIATAGAASGITILNGVNPIRVKLRKSQIFRFRIEGQAPESTPANGLFLPTME